MLFQYRLESIRYLNVGLYCSMTMGGCKLDLICCFLLADYHNENCRTNGLQFKHCITNRRRDDSRFMKHLEILKSETMPSNVVC